MHDPIHIEQNYETGSNYLEIRISHIYKCFPFLSFFVVFFPPAAFLALLAELVISLQDHSKTLQV